MCHQITRLLICLLLLTGLAVISAEQSIPLLSQCPAGEHAVYLLQHNSSAMLSGTVPLRTVPISGGFLECTEQCTAANDCVGVQYSQSGTAGQQQCQLRGIGTGTTTPSDDIAGARLVTKNCVKSARVCSSPFHFDVHEQRILVGFAREVVPAESVQRCLAACLNAFDTFGFECESVMYYPVDAECILNTEDRLDRPDLFVEEHEDTVVYLDNNCAGSQCYAPYVTQYVAVDGRQLVEELDHKFAGMELAECEQLCNQRLSVTANDFNCKSFMYNNASGECVLSDERSRPLGRANLTEVAGGWTYYEKKCFASPRTCRNVASFTRVPQMLLVGFASFVMENVPSVTMCLDQCTNPPPETGQNFACKSVMYYYNEQECILNAESRHTKPDLFIPEEDDFTVDYFDINCRLETEQCPGAGGGRAPKLVRTLNAALPEGEGAIHVVETARGGVQECAQKCADHVPDKCRSFNYDKSSGTCNMLYLDGRGALRPEPKAQVDLYDLHCLDDAAAPAAAQPQSPAGCLDPEGAVFSRHLYAQWVGSEPSKLVNTIPLSKCLNLCSSGAGERCEGLNYNRRNGTCALFGQLAQHPSAGGAMERAEHVDFYQNVCTLRELNTEQSSAANVPKVAESIINKKVDEKDHQQRISVVNGNGAHTKKPSIRPDSATAGAGAAEPNELKKGAAEQVKQFGVASADGRVDKDQQPSVPSKTSEGVTSGNAVDSESSAFSVVSKGIAVDPAQLAAPVQIPAAEVHTICNYEGISVQIKHGQPFSGVMFVKNKYDTCRVEVESKDSVTLVLGLPANFGMKPISLTPSAAGPQQRRPKAHGGGTLAAGNATAESAGGDDAGAERSASAEAAAEQLQQQQQEEPQQQKKHKRRHRRQSQRDCGLIDLDNGTYKTVVVVQTNNLGIPGLVTSMDQLYEISCNYSSMLGGKVTAAANLTLQGPYPSLIQPRGKIELGNPVMMQMMPLREPRSSISEDGTVKNNDLREPLLQAKLGDILELRWELMAMDDELDFLVKDCYAEPGIAPQKSAVGEANKQRQQTAEKLQLIQEGCPTPAVAQKLIPNPIRVLSSAVKVVHMQAFRFDSSSSVRLTCHLELCKGDCKPVSCRTVEGTKESWGRKKRSFAEDNSVTEFQTRHFKVPRFAQATTSLVIIDPLRKFSEPVAAPFQAHSGISRFAADNMTAAAAPITDDLAIELDSSELCLDKWTVGGVLGTLMALILVQSAVVAKHMCDRLRGSEETK